MLTLRALTLSSIHNKQVWNIYKRHQHNILSNGDHYYTSLYAAIEKIESSDVSSMMINYYM